MYKLMQTVTEIIDTFKKEGYSNDFSIKDGKICCNTEGKTYAPDELIIEKTERYEGDSNPSDSAIVYAITGNDGNKGILIDSYGAYSDPKLAKVIGAIPVREEHSLQDKRI